MQCFAGWAGKSVAISVPRQPMASRETGIFLMKRRTMSGGTSRALSVVMEMLAAMVLLLFVAIGTLPAWPYSRRWTFYPTGACGGVVLFLLAMILTGHF